MSVNMQDIDNSIDTRIVFFLNGHISYQIDRWFCLTDLFLHFTWTIFLPANIEFLFECLFDAYI